MQYASRNIHSAIWAPWARPARCEAVRSIVSPRTSRHYGPEPPLKVGLNLPFRHCWRDYGDALREGAGHQLAVLPDRGDQRDAGPVGQVGVRGGVEHDDVG